MDFFDSEKGRNSAIAEFDEAIEKLDSTHTGILRSSKPIEEKQDLLARSQEIRDSLIHQYFQAVGRVHLYTGIQEKEWMSLCGAKSSELHIHLDKFDMDTIERYPYYQRCHKCWDHPNYELAVLGNTEL